MKWTRVGLGLVMVESGPTNVVYWCWPEDETLGKYTRTRRGWVWGKYRRRVRLSLGRCTSPDVPGCGKRRRGRNPSPGEGGGVRDWCNRRRPKCLVWSGEWHGWDKVDGPHRKWGHGRRKLSSKRDWRDEFWRRRRVKDEEDNILNT